MKKCFLLLLAMFGMLLTACERDDAEIKLSKQSIEVEYMSNTYTVSVTSPCSWKAVSDNEWIVIENKTGIAGTKELSFKVERNMDKKEREGTIVVKNSDYNLISELYVIQNGISDEKYGKYVILYTSFDGNVVTPYTSECFGANIVSNTYENGKGTIMFDAPVISIGDSIFYDCSSLTSITIPDGVTSIGDCAFSNCKSLTSVTIGESVTTIGERAFLGCGSLTSIIIPNRVTSIKRSVFYNCSSLTSITIPDSVTSIGDWAFCNCKSLTSVTIKDSVTTIGERAFLGCRSLTSVYCKPTTPPIGGDCIFSYYNNGYKPIGCKIYVPTASVEAYKSADYWSDYADYIEGLDF